MHFLRPTIGGLLIASIAGAAHAQSIPPKTAPVVRVTGSAPKTARATRITGATPSIDGRLEDAAWSAVPVISDFVQKIPVEGAAPSVATEVRILYDDDALYI